jgi:hypothetical protein
MFCSLSDLSLKFTYFLYLLISFPFLIYDFISEKIINNKNIAKLSIYLLVTINYFNIGFIFYLYSINISKNSIYFSVISYISNTLYFLATLNLDKSIYFKLKNLSTERELINFNYIILKFFMTFLSSVNILYLIYYYPKLIFYLTLLSLLNNFIKINIFKQLFHRQFSIQVYPIELIIEKNIVLPLIDTVIQQCKKYKYECKLNDIIESSISYENHCSDECNECKCLFCLTNMNQSEVYKTKCNHIFHKECMDKWLSQSKNNTVNCILCRQSLI